MQPRIKKTAAGKIINEVSVLKDKPVKLSLFDKIQHKLNGNKTTIGLTGMFVGGVLSIIPATSVLGQGIFWPSSAMAGVGQFHRKMKESKFGKPGEVDWLLLKNELTKVFQLLAEFIKKKGDKK